MRKRGFEPWFAALEAETPQLRLWGFEPPTYKRSTISIVFLVALRWWCAPKIFIHRGQLVLAGIAA